MCVTPSKAFTQFAKPKSFVVQSWRDPKQQLLKSPEYRQLANMYQQQKIKLQ